MNNISMQSTNHSQNHQQLSYENINVGVNNYNNINGMSNDSTQHTRHYYNQMERQSSQVENQQNDRTIIQKGRSYVRNNPNMTIVYCKQLNTSVFHIAADQSMDEQPQSMDEQPQSMDKQPSSNQNILKQLRERTSKLQQQQTIVVEKHKYNAESAIGCNNEADNSYTDTSCFVDDDKADLQQGGRIHQSSKDKDSQNTQGQLLLELSQQEYCRIDNYFDCCALTIYWIQINKEEIKKNKDYQLRSRMQEHFIYIDRNRYYKTLPFFYCGQCGLYRLYPPMGFRRVAGTKKKMQNRFGCYQYREKQPSQDHYNPFYDYDHRRYSNSNITGHNHFNHNKGDSRNNRRDIQYRQNYKQKNVNFHLQKNNYSQTKKCSQKLKTQYKVKDDKVKDEKAKDGEVSSVNQALVCNDANEIKIGSNQNIDEINSMKQESNIAISQKPKTEQNNGQQVCSNNEKIKVEQQNQEVNQQIQQKNQLKKDNQSISNNKERVKVENDISNNKEVVKVENINGKSDKFLILLDKDISFDSSNIGESAVNYQESAMEDNSKASDDFEQSPSNMEKSKQVLQDKSGSLSQLQQQNQQHHDYDLNFVRHEPVHYKCRNNVSQNESSHNNDDFIRVQPDQHLQIEKKNRRMDESVSKIKWQPMLDSSIKAFQCQQHIAEQEVVKIGQYILTVKCKNVIRVSVHKIRTMLLKKQSSSFLSIHDKYEEREIEIQKNYKSEQLEIVEHCLKQQITGNQLHHIQWHFANSCFPIVLIQVKIKCRNCRVVNLCLVDAITESDFAKRCKQCTKFIQLEIVRHQLKHQ